MRKILLTLLVLTNISTVFAQIKMAQISEKKEETIFVYDSLSNIKRNIDEDAPNYFKHLTGQQILVVYYSWTMGGLTFFKGHGGYYESLKYELSNEEANALQGKTFIVDSTSYEVGKYFFHMHEKQFSSRQITMMFDSESSWKINQSCVSVGYYEKIKQLYLGQELVYIHKDDDSDLQYSLSRDRFMDYNTKRNLAKKIPRNSVWKCTDVLVLPGKLNFEDCDDRVILNIENETYGKYYILASELKQLKECGHEKFLSMEDFHKYQAIQNQLIAEAKAKAAKATAAAAKRENDRRSSILSKYGEYYGKLIIEGKVIIGMTKQQCIEAWGNPKQINRTITASIIYEQWVYSAGRYLYFENGKLVTIQD